MKKIENQLLKYKKMNKTIITIILIVFACVITYRGSVMGSLSLMVIIPFVCRMFYDQTAHIVAISLIIGAISGFFNVLGFGILFPLIFSISSLCGVFGAMSLKKVYNEPIKKKKILYLILSIILLRAGISINVEATGTPWGYMEAKEKINSYVKKNYEDGTLKYKKTSYNWYMDNYYNVYEYFVRGSSQEVHIDYSKRKEIYDQFKFEMEQLYTYEREIELQGILNGLMDKNLRVSAGIETEDYITRDELNDHYYNLTYDMEKFNKTKEKREKLNNKITYIIRIKDNEMKDLILSKEELTDLAIKIRNTIGVHEINFLRVTVKCSNGEDSSYEVWFDKNTDEEGIIKNYKYEKK
ncbi:YfjL-like protein [Anaeromicrobium sediminis]|uniref:YfjL-like N-terminal domain-containing protein n=1 Tax=Anaeromicrobium sediminis TaxID=1478221 RepID=A0A267ME39_9FIRM|nr:hypothetical protein [Anaeromicrobium sediminis]PAB57844.1 hypothetical protein CCE28_17750 [Anaeromicrobium sediminis]